MSFTDRLMLWFHVAFVIFTIGPVTVATMSSPRAIRTRNTPVLRYLTVMTTVFGGASLGVLGFGMSLGQSLGDLGTAWLTVSITLYVVAFVLLALIVRDQRRAIAALEAAADEEAAIDATGPADDAGGPVGAQADTAGEGGEPASPDTASPDTASSETAAPGPAAPGPAAPVPPAPGPAGIGGLVAATVARGRIASLSGVVSLIWLAILVLMVWNS